ncbi:BlaI/MecI/CopY family transcriptional regulator [Pseudoxanthomonas sp. 10H]|uniref:BlaI/MecI/CopY family transcriptional regulator n=1 Tax=Pseudoxanthomonas sp. 10H TaxID=3242729 RepID=UPI003558FA66
MDTTPISEAEATVMDVLWDASPRSAEEVIAALGPRTGWAEPTIKTLLNRLLNKGAISAEKEGRRYLYSPVLQRDAWVQQQSEGLLARLFGGRVAPLVAHFSERGQLSAADIAELKRLVSELDDGEPGKTGADQEESRDGR